MPIREMVGAVVVVCSTAPKGAGVTGSAGFRQEVGDLDLAGLDLVRQAADLVLDGLREPGRRIELVQGEERRPDTVLGETVRHRAPLELALGEIADRLLTAEVG